MSYEDNFKSPAHYYKRINRLVDHYRSLGYVNLVYDWERGISKVADLPDLRYLANRADSIYESLQGGAHK